MKICYLSTLYNDNKFGGGVRNYLNIVSSELAQKGHTITVLTTGSKTKTKNGVTIVGLGNLETFKSNFVSPIFIIRRVTYMIRAYKFVNRNKIDIVESSDGGFEHLFLAMQKNREYKLITRLHGRTSLTKRVFFSSILNFLENIAIKNSDSVSCPTNSYAQVLNVKCKIIPYPVNVNVKFKRVSIRSKYKLPQKKIVLTASMLSVRKGTDIILKVAKRFSNYKELVFVILGSNLENFDTSKFPKNVLYLGNKGLNELHSFYKECDIFFMPSRFETFGIACVEAMAHSKPVVVSNVTGLKDIVIHNKNGLLFDVQNPNKAYEYILRLLNSKVLAKKLGKAAAIKSKKYSVENVIEIMEDYYKKIL